MANRKKRIDEQAAAVKVKSSDGGKIQPPVNVTLTETGMPFFDDVIEKFTRSDWTAHQVR